MAWFLQNQTLVFAALFAFSELLGAIPDVKSNGVFQFITNLMTAFIKVSQGKCKD